MSEQKQPKQFSITGYTPGGYAVSIPFELPDIPNQWDAYDKRMQQLGLSPFQAIRRTKTETITHVARRDHYNKSGTTSPHIAFYSASQHLEMRYLHLYMDTRAERKAFEDATGISIDSIPVQESDSHPKRDGSPLSKKYIIALPHPITVEYTEETFIGDDGSEGTRKTLTRYISSPSPSNGEGARGRGLPDASETVSEGGVAPDNPTASSDATVGAGHVPPAEDKSANFRQLERKAPSVQSSRVPVTPFAQPEQSGGFGTMPKRDDKRGKITCLRVHGLDLAVGDCVKVEVNAKTFEKEIWTIASIGDADPQNKYRRPATVRVEGKELREVTFNAARGMHLSYHMVVGGSKLNTAADDPTSYDIIPNVGATWRRPRVQASAS